MSGIDLKSIRSLGHTSTSPWKENCLELWPDRLFPTHGFLTATRIPPMRRTLSRPLQSEVVFLYGSISLYGFCSIDIPRKLARYRNLPPHHAKQTVSHRTPKPHLSYHVGQSQRTTRWAYLCRLGSRPHPSCQNYLCLRFHHDRSLSLALSLGAISSSKSRSQAPYPDGFAREPSRLYSHHQRKSSRRQCPGPLGSRSRIHLCDGPRVSRFRPSLPYPSTPSHLCDPGQIQSAIFPLVFSAGRPIHRIAQRSDHPAERILFRARIPRTPPPHSVLRHQAPQISHLSDQSIYLTRVDDCPPLPVSLASGIVFQMEQTTSSHQSVLWDNRKCRQTPNLDCHIGLCPRGDSQETLETRTQFVHDHASVKCHSIRKETDPSIVFRMGWGGTS